MLSMAVYIAELLVLLYAGTCVVYWLVQEKFLFVPTLPGEAFEIKLGTHTEQMLLEVPHQGTIHALYLKVPHPRGLIFYLHGNTGSLKRWQFNAEELAHLGFNVFVLDYRGYGKSKGIRTEAILHRDVEFCFDHITAQFQGEVIIYGRSLGSGFATRLAHHRKAQALVLETPFYSLERLAAWYLPFLPVRWLLRYRLRSDLHLPHVECPIHIFHGTKDIVVPYNSALALYRLVAHRSDVYLTTLSGGAHSNLNRYPLFHNRLKEFLYTHAGAEKEGTSQVES